MDKDGIRIAYDDVRDDSTDTNWAVFKYDSSNNIIVDSTGIEFEEFKSKFDDSERAFAFLRVYTGDELSRRAKFALVAWCGSGVSALKRAKAGTDKAVVREICQSYVKDFLFSEQSEFNEDKIREELIKAGGANYGTGN